MELNAFCPHKYMRQCLPTSFFAVIVFALWASEQIEERGLSFYVQFLGACLTVQLKMGSFLHQENHDFRISTAGL